MEKIKVTGEISAGLVASACANKINEIIDELQTIRIERTNIDTVTKEDRLKTLEDKIENVRELLVRSKLVRQEDLWDEQNEIKFNPPVEVETGVEYEVKPTVNIPEKIRVVVGKKDNWGETLEAKDEFEPTVKECDCKCHRERGTVPHSETDCKCEKIEN